MLLVGSGAREHALAWRLSRSPSLTALHAAPGNPGIAALGDCHPVRATDGEGLLDLARTLAADLVVIGPEAPLVAGVGDRLRHAGIPVFGPSAAAARIEGSKAFAKEVLEAAGVPAAATLTLARPPCVVKADGLAAGKGVFVCRTDEEVEAGLRAAAAFGGTVVVEELLEGPEVSLFALCDGHNAVAIGAAQDFKRAFDGDDGPNTGGMGAYSPVPWLADAAELVHRIHQPVLDELTRRGTPFVGCLFAGLMLTADGPRVLEFNARFGDPETQALAPRLEGDLVASLGAAATGDLFGIDVRESAEAARDGRPRRAGLPGAKRLRRRPDRGHRRRGGGGRARLPRRHGARRRHARDERRPHPVGHRARGDRSRGARAGLRGGHARALRRGSPPRRHRRRRRLTRGAAKRRAAVALLSRFWHRHVTIAAVGSIAKGREVGSRKRSSL